jgi:hypothetical protein
MTAPERMHLLQALIFLTSPLCRANCLKVHVPSSLGLVIGVSIVAECNYPHMSHVAAMGEYSKNLIYKIYHIPNSIASFFTAIKAK